MTTELNTKASLQDSLCKLADDLNALIIREHQILQEEMQQVRTIVGDAVKNLDDNFRNLSSQASEQAEILSQVDQTGQVSGEQTRQLSVISEQIRANTSTTIRVLQFDDIVQQLAGHTCDRIARIQELFAELNANLEKVRKLEPEDIPALQNFIASMSDEVQRFRTRLEKENPVRQKTMDAGKIELF